MGENSRKATIWLIKSLPELLLIITFIIFFAVVYTTSDNVGKVEGVPSDNLPAPGGDSSRLFHLIQVSDIHLSKFNPVRREQLLTFCNETVPTIQPTLVLNTGDMVDAVEDEDSFYYLNRQFEEEWAAYRTTLEQAGYFNKSFWLDIRGNHDAFGIPSYNDPGNYFLSYAVYGDQHQYNYVITQPFGTYQIVAVDLSYTMGASSPFNFFGIPPKDLDVVRGYLEEAPSHNHTLLIGHYPRVTSSTFFSWGDLTKNHVLAYLCGHLHTERMYKKMQGYYELELADMKTHRKYRIMAFDHDLYSFHDFYLSEWPVILITNPKNPQFYSDLEPLDLIARSTHIRALVFSTRPILYVTVSVNGLQEFNMTRVEADKPLFVFPWSPQGFGAGLHTITITAVDPERTRSVSQSFSVDKTTMDIDHSFGNAVQNAPITTFSIVIFTFIYLYSFFIMLLIPRVWKWMLKGQIHDLNEVEPLFNQSGELSLWQLIKIAWIEKLVEFQSLCDVTWWIMIFWWIYLLIGPVVIGPIGNQDLYGASFFWGVIANKIYSRSVESFLIPWVLLLLLYIPFLSTLIRMDYAILQQKSPISFGFLSRLFLSLAFSCFSLFLLTLYETWVGLLISPAVTWFIVVALALLIWRTLVYKKTIKGKASVPGNP